MQKAMACILSACLFFILHLSYSRTGIRSHLFRRFSDRIATSLSSGSRDLVLVLVLCSVESPKFPQPYLTLFFNLWTLFPTPPSISVVLEMRECNVASSCTVHGLLINPAPLALGSRDR